MYPGRMVTLSPVRHRAHCGVETQVFDILPGRSASGRSDALYSSSNATTAAFTTSLDTLTLTIFSGLSGKSGSGSSRKKKPVIFLYFINFYNFQSFFFFVLCSFSSLSSSFLFFLFSVFFLFDFQFLSLFTFFYVIVDFTVIIDFTQWLTKRLRTMTDKIQLTQSSMAAM